MELVSFILRIWLAIASIVVVVGNISVLPLVHFLGQSGDPDFRFMATQDLAAELSKESFQLDETTERKVVQAVLKLLEDKNGEVQGSAVKALSPLVKKIRENQLQETIDHLFNLVSQKKSEDLRDIASIGLKTVIQAIPSAEGSGSGAAAAGKEKARGEAAGGMVKKLVPKLVQQLKVGKS